MTQEKSLNIGYINLRAQTGFGLPKQIQVEQFLKSYKIDILHLQEAHTVAAKKNAPPNWYFLGQ